MSRPQRRPNKAITQLEQQTALEALLIQREKLPDEFMQASLARSYGVHVDYVKALVARIDLQRRLRA